jgi:hypothetical protein
MAFTYNILRCLCGVGVGCLFLSVGEFFLCALLLNNHTPNDPSQKRAKGDKNKKVGDFIEPFRLP